MTTADALVDRLALALRARGAMLATAESCTGGLIAAACTSVAGSSEWFERGFVTYSNAAKTEMLGVPATLLAAHGAVSAEVACAMASGALAHSRARIAVAVTGIAGPGGGTAGKPVGTVWLAVAMDEKRTEANGDAYARTDAVGAASDGSAALATATLLRATGDRASIRARAVVEALALALERIERTPARR